MIDPITGTAPNPLGVRYGVSPLDSCEECLAYWRANRDSLSFAAASLGIERGLTTNQTLWAYFRDFHEAGHVTAKGSE